MTYRAICPKCNTQYYEQPSGNVCDWCAPDVSLIVVTGKEQVKENKNNVHQPQSRY